MNQSKAETMIHVWVSPSIKSAATDIVPSKTLEEAWQLEEKVIPLKQWREFQAAETAYYRQWTKIKLEIQP